MKINKVLTLPTLPCAGNEMFFVKNEDIVDCYVSNDTGTQLYKVFDSKNYSSIDGPRVVLLNSTNTYTITDYDSETEYVLTSSLGTVTRTNELITFEAGSVKGIGNFTINGLVVEIIISNDNTAPTVNEVQIGLCLRYDIYDPFTINTNDGSILLSDYDYRTELRFLRKYNNDGTVSVNEITTSEHPILVSTINNDIIAVTCNSVDNYPINTIYITKYDSNGNPITTYGTDGLSEISISDTTSLDIYYNLSVQSDGKLLVFGYHFIQSAPSVRESYILRVNQDGSLDTTFGINGFKKYTINDTSYTYINFVKQNTNGDIFMIQQVSTDGVSSDNILVKHTSAGVVDTTFGINGGIVLSSNHSAITDFFIDDINKITIVAVNNTSEIITLFKYNADGTVDTTYGNNGVFETNYITPDSYVACLDNRGILITSDLHLVGTNINLTNLSCIRITETGAIDNTFNNTGIQMLLRGASINSKVYNITKDNTGRIYIHYSLWSFIRYENELAIYRLNSNGSIDYSYSDVVSTPDTGRYVNLGESIPIFQQITLNDAELTALNNDQGNYNGCILTISSTKASDSFSGINGLSFNSGNVILNNETIGTVSALNDFVITFNNNATKAKVIETLRSILYTNNELELTEFYDLFSLDWNINLEINDGNQGEQGIGGPGIITYSLTMRYVYGIPIGIDYCSGDNKVRNITNYNGYATTIVIEYNNEYCINNNQLG